MRYKAILVGEKVESGKYPLVKQIFGDTVDECMEWASEMIKGTKSPICVEIYETKWQILHRVYNITEPHNSPPAYEVKSLVKKDAE